MSTDDSHESENNSNGNTKKDKRFSLQKFLQNLDTVLIPKNISIPTSERSNLQLGRRLFHFLNGATVATLYNLFLSHQQVVSALGLGASILYVLEQVRINYPELAHQLNFINNFLLRAEEELKESSAVPYAFAMLLTIISFPKVVAIIAIYTLSIADPMSALIGIAYGKHKISKNKSLEGSFAFFISTLLCSLMIFFTSMEHPFARPLVWSLLQVSLLVAFLSTLVEMVPFRIDDNLTIPLSVALITWPLCILFGIPLN